MYWGGVELEAYLSTLRSLMFLKVQMKSLAIASCMNFLGTSFVFSYERP
jgi:hypothetical protein